MFVDGDNLLQNLPLRVLVGSDLRQGVLPLWNPYLFSGTPLLAGFNAGAAYPATWLMAVLPTFTAWTSVRPWPTTWPSSACTSSSVVRPSAPTAATFGAATFAFAGFMTAQMVHIDLIREQPGCRGWHGRPRAHRRSDRTGAPARAAIRAAAARRRGWVALLAVSVGLSILTGGAEAIIDSGVLVAVYCGGPAGRRGRISHRAAPARPWPLGGSPWPSGWPAAWPWVPPSGSRGPPSPPSRSGRRPASPSSPVAPCPYRLLTLLASPFVLGTNQGRPGYYAGPYNFPEVTSYMGILALIAVCSLFLRYGAPGPRPVTGGSGT